MTRGRLYAFWVSPWADWREPRLPCRRRPRVPRPDRYALMRDALARLAGSTRRVRRVHAAALSLVLGLFFTFVRAPHPWGWQGIDQYHELAQALARGEPFAHDRRAVGLRLLRRRLLRAVRRARLGAGAGAGRRQRGGRRAALPPGRSRWLAPHGRARRPAGRRLLVQHRLRVDASLRRDLHGAVPGDRSLAFARGASNGRRWRFHRQRPAVRHGAAVPSQPDPVACPDRRSPTLPGRAHVAQGCADGRLSGVSSRSRSRRGSSAITGSPDDSCRPARMAAFSCGTARCRSGRIWKAAPTIRDRSSSRRRSTTRASPATRSSSRHVADRASSSNATVELIYWTDRDRHAPTRDNDRGRRRR